MLQILRHFSKLELVRPIVYKILSKMKHNLKVSIYKFATRRHFKIFERGIHYIFQNPDKQQAGILPFFQFSFAYIELHRSKHNIWKTVGLCYEPCRRFQNTLFSKSQTNQNKQSLILILFSSSLHVVHITAK